jgi:hypothetical protein
VLHEASAFKNGPHGGAVFAMGGWSGSNMADADPQVFLRHTAMAFPTMGYGFNRSLWRHINALSYEILEGVAKPLDDWSDALALCLKLEYERTHNPQLEIFGIHEEVQVIQPTLSRVWHIGHESSIGTDGLREVSENPPWHAHSSLLQSGVFLNHTLKPGLHNYGGEMCRDAGACKKSYR